MAWGKTLVRTAAGFTGKAITLIFAVFCVITGLFSEGSAQPVTGTVRSRADFSPIRNIQVILSDLMCPLYGMYLPCSIGRAVDTATTGNNGVFTISSTAMAGGFLTLTDIDSTKNGSFQPRSIMSVLPTLTGPGSVLYMVPKNTAYPVRGKVLSYPDSLPIKGILAVLWQSIPRTGYPPLPDYIAPLDTAFSDANGSITFALDTEITTAKISVSDIDSVENGGRFLANSSGYFSPINDTATTIIYMGKDLTPVSRPLTERASSAAPVIRTIDGVVSVALRNWQPRMHAQVLILDARGVTVARLQPSAGGIVKWNTSRVPRGIYCMCIEGSGIPTVARIILP